MIHSAAIIVLLLLIAVVPHPALARSCHHPEAASGQVGWMPEELLRRPASIRDGIGTVHDRVTTSSPEAQAFYDQRMA